MSQNGIDYQIRAYIGMDQDSDLPVSVSEWRQKARELLADGPWWYLEGAAGNNDTMNNNINAFQQYAIRPRYLRNVENREQNIEIFGKKYDSPFILAPIGVQSIIHKDAEMASAGAAAEMGVPFILSTVSSKSIEEISTAYPDSEKWFQLYPGKDEKVMESMIHRAEKAGYTAIIVTVDTTMLGWREQDLKNAYLPFLLGEGIANFTTDPEFRKRLSSTPENDMQSAIEEFLTIYVNPAFQWEDFKKIRKITRLPLLIKGITHIEDVRLAAKYGADGVIISNHGGRQVDGAIPAIKALEMACSEKLPITVLFDSGIRHGADAMKALALGASAILIGRPYCYALGVAGKRGVVRYLAQLKSELDLQMGLSGFNSLSALSSSDIIKI
ncbi:MAG: alpha-hydroxy-acid oxidizing protein [Ferroplasma sp.]